MSLTAFFVAVGDGIQAEDWPETEARASVFLSGLTNQPTFRHEMPGAVLLQSSVYPDESAVAVCRRTTADRDVMVVFDGWLENRAELEDRLKRIGAVSGSPDAELVLLAYLAWNSHVAEHLFGEYSFVVVERFRSSVSCRVHAVRDRVGFRPAYWVAQPAVLWLSNFPGTFLRLGGAPTQPNWSELAAFILYQPGASSETFVAQIKRLPGGHCLSLPVGSTTPIAARYDTRSGGASAPQLSAEEAHAQFAIALRTAVVAASRASGTLGVQVSGGVDSSSVAVFVADACDLGLLHPERVLGLHNKFDHPMCDESHFAEALAARLPFRLATVRANYSDSRYLEFATRRLHYPYQSFAGTASIPGLRHLLRNEARVCLTGELGDLLFVPTRRTLFRALLGNANRRAIAHYLLQRWRHLGRNASLLGRGYYTVSPLLPVALTSMADKWTHRGLRTTTDVVLSSSWMEEWRAWNGRIGKRPEYTSRTEAQALVFEQTYVRSLEAIFAANFIERVECRHPLGSARVIAAAGSFPLALLDGQRAQNRVPLRLAVQHRLPRIVAERNWKCEFSPVALPALRRAVCDRLQIRNEPCSIDFGDDRYAQVDLAECRYVWQLDALLSAKLWLDAN